MGGYQDACAAFRAGTTRFSGHHDLQSSVPGDEEPAPITIAGLPDHLDGYQGKSRLVKMLEFAYRDLEHNLGRALPLDKITCYLAMPDPVDRLIQEDDENIERDSRLLQFIDSLLASLSTNLKVALHALPVQGVFGDRTAFARILQKALTTLGEGGTQYCLLMVADSLLDDEVLQEQLTGDALLTATNPVGYIPGEGAALILLASGSAAKASPMAHACVMKVAIENTPLDIDDEAGVLEKWQGNTLLELTEQVLPRPYDHACLPQRLIDTNGEEKRAAESGYLEMKLRRQYPEHSELDPVAPADGFGETGALAGALAVAIATASVQRGYARHRRFLITLSEESGKRAVIYSQF